MNGHIYTTTWVRSHVTCQIYQNTWEESKNKLKRSKKQLMWQLRIFNWILDETVMLTLVMPAQGLLTSFWRALFGSVTTEQNNFFEIHYLTLLKYLITKFTKTNLITCPRHISVTVIICWADLSFIWQKMIFPCFPPLHTLILVV
jgi:hypothetical protein